MTPSEVKFFLTSSIEYFKDSEDNLRGGPEPEGPGKRRYKLNGSGIPHRFCIDGSRKEIRKDTELPRGDLKNKNVTYHARGVPVTKRNVEFRLEIKIFGG